MITVQVTKPYCTVVAYTAHKAHATQRTRLRNSARNKLKLKVQQGNVIPNTVRTLLPHNFRVPFPFFRNFKFYDDIENVTK
jgi:hypothetical protein